MLFHVAGILIGVWLMLFVMGYVGGRIVRLAATQRVGDSPKLTDEEAIEKLRRH